MVELIVQQNQLLYTGTYSRPAFQLWDAGGTIIGGLYDAFNSLDVSLGDIKAEETGQSPLDQGVTVAFGLDGIYKFRFDKVELSFVNFTDQTLDKLPAILSAADKWLRGAVPDLKLRMHQFQYGGHSGLSEGSADEILQRVVKADFDVQDGPLHAGVILRWNQVEKGWGVQLTLDHSQVIAGGLFVWFAITIMADGIDYNGTATEGRAVLEKSLAQFGLAFNRG